VCSAIQFLDTFYHKGTIGVVIDDGPHLLQINHQIHNLRLDGRVADERAVFGDRGCEEQIFGGGHAGIGEHNFGTG
jgi:hypothetical protein